MFCKRNAFNLFSIQDSNCESLVFETKAVQKTIRDFITSRQFLNFTLKNNEVPTYKEILKGGKKALS